MLYHSLFLVILIEGNFQDVAQYLQYFNVLLCDVSGHFNLIFRMTKAAVFEVCIHMICYVQNFLSVLLLVLFFVHVCCSFPWRVLFATECCL